MNFTIKLRLDVAVPLSYRTGMQVDVYRYRGPADIAIVAMFTAFPELREAVERRLNKEIPQ